MPFTHISSYLEKYEDKRTFEEKFVEWGLDIEERVTKVEEKVKKLEDENTFA